MPMDFLKKSNALSPNIIEEKENNGAFEEFMEIFIEICREIKQEHLVISPYTME